MTNLWEGEKIVEKFEESKDLMQKTTLGRQDPTKSRCSQFFDRVRGLLTEAEKP